MSCGRRRCCCGGVPSRSRGGVVGNAVDRAEAAYCSRGAGIGHRTPRRPRPELTRLRRSRSPVPGEKALATVGPLTTLFPTDPPRHSSA